jgi:Na+/melibiose symporter-like transporter
VVALLSAISFGNTEGWTSPVIVFLFLAALVLGAAFVVRERACAEPMLDLALFSHRRFAVGITSGMLSYLVLFGVLFLVPFYLDRGLGLGSGRAGLELMAMPLAQGIAAPFAGRAADRFGARTLTAGGMLLTAAGLAVLGCTRPPVLGFVLLLGVIGAGLGCFTPPNNAAIMGSVPRQQAGVASGVLNMTRGIGTALGLAVTGLIFAVAGGQSVSPAAVSHAFSGLSSSSPPPLRAPGRWPGSGRHHGREVLPDLERSYRRGEPKVGAGTAGHQRPGCPANGSSGAGTDAGRPGRGARHRRGIGRHRN